MTLTLNSGILKSMKQCPGCKELTDNFARNKAKKDGLQSMCRSCIKEINKRYYKATPEKNAQRLAYKAQQGPILRAHVKEWLQSHPCVDCGEDDWLVLEFDHVRGKKKRNIASIIGNGYSLETLQLEIAKCDVRCANCHRRVTAKRAGWWRTL